MALSTVQICNMALANVGASSIESLAQSDASGRQCRTFYDLCRKMTLEAFPWKFASKVVTLSEDSDDAPELRWAYRYQYPANCIKVQYLENPAGKDVPPVPFELELDSTGSRKTILTDLQDATAVITLDVTDPGLFTLHFVDTLAHLLAAKVAFPLTGKRAVGKDEGQLWFAGLAMASGQNANEGQDDLPVEAPWIAGR